MPTAMSLKAQEQDGLDQEESPLYKKRYSISDDSDLSDVEDLTPLKIPNRHYTDEAGAFDTEKKGLKSRAPVAWLDGAEKRSRWRRWLIPSKFCCLLVVVFVAAVMLILGAGGLWVYKAASPGYGHSDPWYPTPQGGTVESWKDAYRKAADLVGQMTLAEKVNVTTGVGWSMGMCVGNTAPVPRLGFPSLCLQDGPLSLRFVDNITAWPAGITVGATWNRQLMYERGKAYGFEAKKKGVHTILGPSMGAFGRLPAGGRNWEGFGPDPVLQGVASANIIKGIQHMGVMATAKHYVANEQEHFRQPWEWGLPNAISSNVDDRTMHEIYAWPFADSVRAGVASVMCSYNQVNSSYACQNSKLLNGLLKDEMGFQGFVQSDWLAQRSGVASALAGLDVTMPGDGLIWENGDTLWGGLLSKAVLNGSVPVDRLNDMALRTVAAWYQLGQDSDDWPEVNFSSWTDDEVGELHPGSPDSDETGIVNKFVPVRQTKEGGDHDKLARQVAAEGIVLLKNDGDILPVARNGTGRKTRVGIFGEDAFPNPKGINACPDRSCNEGTLTMGWGSGAVELPYLVSPAEALHANFDNDTTEITEWKKNDISKIESKAAKQDLCFVFVSSDAGEGFHAWDGVRGDRNDLYPQKGGDKLVKHVAAACEKTIVVLHTVGPTILEEWIDLPNVKGVLVAHLPGSESGNALADVVFGDISPSGKLPYTIAKAEKDYGPTSGILYYPNGVVPQQNFSEGLYVDYRYFDKFDVTPRYEFGYGGSYTTFELSDLAIKLSGNLSAEPKPRADGVQPPRLDNKIPDASEAYWPKGFRQLKKYIYPYISRDDKISKGAYPYPDGYDTSRTPSAAGGGEGGNPDLFEVAASVSVTLANTGSRDGDAVVQLYLSYPEKVKDADGEHVDTPVKVLRGFEKVTVGKGGDKKVEMELTRRDLSFWDVKRQNWVVPEGEFEVKLGFSSRDLPIAERLSVR